MKQGLVKSMAEYAPTGSEFLDKIVLMEGVTFLSIRNDRNSRFVHELIQSDFNKRFITTITVKIKNVELIFVDRSDDYILKVLEAI